MWNEFPWATEETLLKSNMNARIRGLPWMTDQGQILKLTIVSVMTNLMFCMWISSLWLIIPTADELSYFTVGCFQTSITPRFLQSWLAKRDTCPQSTAFGSHSLHLLSAGSKWQTESMQYVGRRRGQIKFSTQLHMSSPLVPYFIASSLYFAGSPLSRDPLHPLLPSGLARLSVWLPIAVTCPHHLFSPAPHLFTCCFTL